MENGPSRRFNLTVFENPNWRRTYVVLERIRFFVYEGEPRGTVA